MIDVHIGFMDEEVSELLRCLIDMFGKDRPVLAIERGKIAKGGALFETPFSKYVAGGDEGVTINHVEFTTGNASAQRSRAGLGGRLARNLYEEFYGDMNFVQRRIKNRALLGEEIKMDGAPSFSIIHFNAKEPKATENPIIVIRNPEMGKQPSQVRPYERAILKAISGLEEAHKTSDLNGARAGIRIHSFASGGAIDPGIKPGFISRPMASLYVGAEVDEQGRVYAAVNLMALRKAFTILIPAHIEFFRRETAITSELTEFPENDEKLKEIMNAAHEEAMKDAERYILKAHDDLLVQTLQNLSDRYKDNECSPFEPLKAAASLTPDITASFSYFDSLETKKSIWKKMKQTVVNSNMEDYHVLRLVKSMLEKGGSSRKYAPLIDCEILRLNANVFIPEALTKKLIEHLASARLTKEAYVASIVWGLKGCPLNGLGELPEDMRNWRFYDSFDKQSEYRSYFYTHEGHCLDPFCCEIATDLLKELIGNKGGMVSPKAFELAQKVKAEAQNNAQSGNFENVFRLATELVDEMANNGYGVSGDEMYCWLRPKKWKNITGAILKSETARELVKYPANVDRVLYKSANLLALQVLARTAAERTAIPNLK